MKQKSRLNCQNVFVQWHISNTQSIQNRSLLKTKNNVIGFTSICLKNDWQFAGWGTSGLICTVKCEKTPWWTTNERTPWIIPIQMILQYFMTLLSSIHNWNSKCCQREKRSVIDEQCENLASLAWRLPKIISAMMLGKRYISSSFPWKINNSYQKLGKIDLRSW